MTIQLATPGCFRSMLFYRVDAPECERCALAKECANALVTRTESFLERVQRFDAAFAQDRAKSVQRALIGRLKRDRSKDRKSATAQATLDKLSASGVNVYELRHRMNPAPKHSLLHRLFQIMIDLKAFARRDLVEELCEAENNNLSQAEAKRQVDTVCDALLHAGVLKTESRGILCLN